MNWEAAETVDLSEEPQEVAEEAGEGSRVRRSRSRSEMALAQMEDARDGSRPVILFVGTQSDERRYQRVREQCEQLQEQLFSSYRPATAMQDFTLVRANVEDLDAQVCRRYGIQRNVAPQMIVYNCELRRMYTMTGVPGEAVFIQRLESAKEQNDALLERREREARRDAAR